MNKEYKPIFGPIKVFYFRGEYYDKKDENGETEFVKDLKKKNKSITRNKRRVYEKK